MDGAYHRWGFEFDRFLAIHALSYFPEWIAQTDFGQLKRKLCIFFLQELDLFGLGHVTLLKHFKLSLDRMDVLLEHFNEGFFFLQITSILTSLLFELAVELVPFVLQLPANLIAAGKLALEILQFLLNVELVEVLELFNLFLLLGDGWYGAFLQDF